MQFQTLARLLLLWSALMIAGSAALFYFAMTRQNVNSAEFLTVSAAIVATFGVAIMTAALGSVLSRREANAQQLDSTLSRIQQQIGDLQQKAHESAITLEKLSHRQQTPIGPVTLAPGALAAVSRQLEEIRDISLLSEEERATRMSTMEQERKLARIRAAMDMYERKRWADAETAILKLENEYRGQLEIRQLRVQFDEARRLAEDDAVAEAHREIEKCLNMSAYERAADVARRTIADFPSNAPSKALAVRVQREYDIYRETHISRALDDIRAECDNRQWRSAFQRASNLLARFKDHPKLDRLLLQMPTIQSNAEVQERHEMEVQIQELIRAEQLPDAVKLGEDLIARYPESPQAEQMEILLPRLHDMIRDQLQFEQSPEEATGAVRIPGAGASEA